MTERDDLVPLPGEEDELLRAARQATPARLLQGSAGVSYSTPTQLSLRADHAAAVDAVWGELDLERDLGTELVGALKLFEVGTRAGDKREYLLRPDLGRLLSPAAEVELARRCLPGCDLQLVVGDGLSVAAVAAQVPALLPRLLAGAAARGWQVGQPFVVRHCRVGLLNEIGRVLSPRVVVLLIGERPGLSTAESLSAYMAYWPRPGHTDADRNLISSIHARGVAIEVAAERILNLAALLRARRCSGVTVKEELALEE